MAAVYGSSVGAEAYVLSLTASGHVPHSWLTTNVPILHTQGAYTLHVNPPIKLGATSGQPAVDINGKVLPGVHGISESADITWLESSGGSDVAKSRLIYFDATGKVTDVSQVPAATGRAKTVTTGPFGPAIDAVTEFMAKVTNVHFWSRVGIAGGAIGLLVIGTVIFLKDQPTVQSAVKAGAKVMA